MWRGGLGKALTLFKVARTRVFVAARTHPTIKGACGMEIGRSSKIFFLRAFNNGASKDKVMKATLPRCVCVRNYDSERGFNPVIAGSLIVREQGAHHFIVRSRTDWVA